MYNVPLANNSREQNLEIIYNNKLLFFKVIKRVDKNDALKAFPSKDLEIALGLQFIPYNEGKFNLKYNSSVFLSLAIIK